MFFSEYKNYGVKPEIEPENLLTITKDKDVITSIKAKVGFWVYKVELDNLPAHILNDMSKGVELVLGNQKIYFTDIQYNAAG